ALTPAPNQVFRLYYYAAGTRVAVRVLTGASGGNDLYFLHSDHLGSTSMTTDINANVVGQQRYYAYGEPRTPSGTLHTDRRFTGQREETNLGSLYDFNARMYSPLIGRFVSADTLVPDPSNSGTLNRYAFVLNNPIKNIDPTGHEPCESGSGLDCKGGTRNGARRSVDRRNLTSWMPRALTYFANHPKIRSIQEANARAIAAHVPVAGVSTFPEFAGLVQDNAPLDIKRRIESEFQRGPVKLADEWYEYTTPGNIAYGFYGTAAGYDSATLHVGAGVAQAKDYHVDKDGPPGQWEFLLDTYDDYYAIDFGIQLYRNYYAPDGMLTQDEFVTALSTYEYRSALAVKVGPMDYQPGYENMYPADYFTNK
ncbi:MAG: RHS repeat-associated core domain-containing protein, partial [Anaerolineales bacterium]